ncbi:unnamed protein product [Durusdinium trenchii]|uniref:Sulphur transport domain-containing protein n=1 Tax=Durusdinium trenchii TaxID=1381693 RepID=A0ABP0KHF6_9DINO
MSLPFGATRFTPIESSLGGMMIGASAAMAYLIDGKITGISGIMGPFFRGVTKCDPVKDGQLWKLLFLTGLFLGGLVDLALNWDFSFPHAPPLHAVRYLLAGVAVGIGTRVGKGCTSGHGICGLPRFSLRSWISVPTFMAVAAATVAITRHALKMDGTGFSPQIAQLQWPPRWEFPVGAFLGSLSLIALTVLLPDRFKVFVSPLSSGLIFAFGLGASGMTNPSKVMNFLDFGGYWDPSLAFVMGCGICVSGPAFILAEQLGKVTKPLIEGCKFENPPKKGNYVPLVIGASFFGLGWGLCGLCPGPALAALIPKIVTGVWHSWEPDFGMAAAALLIAITWLVTDRVVVYLTTVTQKQGEASAETEKQISGTV